VVHCLLALAGIAIATPNWEAYRVSSTLVFGRCFIPIGAVMQVLLKFVIPFLSLRTNARTAPSFRCCDSLPEVAERINAGNAAFHADKKMFQCEVRSGYFTTDGQSVSMSWYRAPLWDLRPNIASYRNVAIWDLQSCFCGAPSLTRGLVCNLQRNHSMIRVAQNP
jgi:hypothetical protein